MKKRGFFKKLLVSGTAAVLSASMLFNAYAATSDSALSVKDMYLNGVKNKILCNVEPYSTYIQVKGQMKTDVPDYSVSGAYRIMGNGVRESLPNTAVLRTGDLLYTVYTQPEGSAMWTVVVSVRGDVDGDGNLDNDDITEITTHLANLNAGKNYLTLEHFEAADVNRDGTVNIADVMSLARLIQQYS